MEATSLHDEKMQLLLQHLAEAGITNAAAGLSQMIGQRITMSVPRVTLVPITSVADLIGGPDTEVVGIYLASEGDLTGHVMLIMGIEEAYQLVDLLMGQVDHKTTQLDSLARSALAEVGNVTASFFLNAVSTISELSGRPSPPAVIVDMAGAILDIMLVTAGQLSDEVLLLETLFSGEGRQLSMYFWVLPDLEPLRSKVQ